MRAVRSRSSMNLQRHVVAVAAALTTVVLFLGLGDPGVWEPEERVLIDRVAPVLADSSAAAQRSAGTTSATITAPPQREARGDDECLRMQPEGALARSLMPRALRFGRDKIGDTDAGRRLPLAVFGFVIVLAVFALATRLAGLRAGIVTAVVIVSMPLLLLQTRLFMSDIGTPCAATLVVYGLVTFSQPAAGTLTRTKLLDRLLSAAALSTGAVLGFLAGGALLGVVVPLGAFAVTGSLGIPVVYRRQAQTTPHHWLALIATLITIVSICVLAYQMYEVREAAVGERHLFDSTIAAGGCWSWALGGIWLPAPDYSSTFDSGFEQIAYGTFPWGVLAPIAAASLLRHTESKHRLIGLLAFAWAAISWFAAEAFARRVGFMIWAGFPAFALAVGVWLDDMLARRPRPPGDGGASSRLIATYFVLAAVVLGKDLHAFPQRMTSLLTANEIRYPVSAKLGVLPTSLGALSLGLLVAISLGIALCSQRRTIRAAATVATLGATALLAVFWVFAWHPNMSRHLSSKTLFESYHASREAGDELIIMGEYGRAPHAYAQAGPPYPVETTTSRTRLVAALKRPTRVFAVAPLNELCSLHREMSETPYFMIERNVQHALLSNRTGAARDKNPLRGVVVHVEPTQMTARPQDRIVWADKIELLGWDIPDRARAGESIDIVLYYKVLQRVDTDYKSLVEFDRPDGTRVSDETHLPIGGFCMTKVWEPGDFIIDRFSAKVRTGYLGPLEVWVGFVTGAWPSLRNMPLSTAPGADRDAKHRVRIANVVVEE